MQQDRSRPATLYVFAHAPNPRRVRMFLAEKGIDLPCVEVNLAANEHRAPAFLKLNPLGQVPALALEDGTVLTESIAICRYLEEAHPRPALFGTDALDRARVEMWNRRMELLIFNTIGNVAEHEDEFFKDSVVQIPAFAASQRDAALRKWAWLDRELDDGRAFVAGGTFSVADITGAAASWLGEYLKIGIPPSLGNVRRWDDRMRARPSWDA